MNRYLIGCLEMIALNLGGDYETTNRSPNPEHLKEGFLVNYWQGRMHVGEIQLQKMVLSLGVGEFG